MIFDFRRKKFIDDHRHDYLQISGIQFAGPVVPGHFDGAVQRGGLVEAHTARIRDPIISVKNNRLEISCLESQGKIGFSDILSPILDQGTHGLGRNAFPDHVKKSIQEAIDMIADRFGLLYGLPFKLHQFNDRVMLYMYPVLRSLCNERTNFRQLFNNISLAWNVNDGFFYNIHDALIQENLQELVRVSCGTYSREIMKWLTNNLIEKWDMDDRYKFLDNNMIQNMLGTHDHPNYQQFSMKYENIHIVERVKILYFLGDLFDSNVGLINQALSEDISSFPCNTTICNFLKKNFSHKKAIKLIKEADNPEAEQRLGPGYLTDTCEQYSKYSDPESIPPKLKSKYPNGIELPKFKTLKELHDKVSAQYNEIKAEEANRPFEFTEEEWKLHKYKVGSVETILPSEASKVVEWGKQLKHCIASYTEKMARKECLLVGVNVNGKLLYTLEVNVSPKPIVSKREIEEGNIQIDENGNIPLAVTSTSRNSMKPSDRFRILQFYGYRNCRPEDKGDELVKETVQEILRDVFTPEEVQCEDRQTESAL